MKEENDVFYYDFKTLKVIMKQQHCFKYYTKNVTQTMGKNGS